LTGEQPMITNTPLASRRVTRAGGHQVFTAVPNISCRSCVRDKREDEQVTMIREMARQLCLPPLLESAVAMRHAVGAALQGMGGGPEEAADMVLAASEAFNNAICHGSMETDDHLWVGIEAIGMEIVVTLAYRGAPFPVVPPSLPQAHQSHGRGRYLMERLTDRVAYSFAQECTYVELRKRIQGP
jgi:anti-sigma regulatory factor (Ser/Thr protein kinase)